MDVRLGGRDAARSSLNTADVEAKAKRHQLGGRRPTYAFGVAVDEFPEKTLGFVNRGLERLHGLRQLPPRRHEFLHDCTFTIDCLPPRTHNRSDARPAGRPDARGSCKSSRWGKTMARLEDLGSRPLPLGRLAVGRPLLVRAAARWAWIGERRGSREEGDGCWGGWRTE